MGHRKTVHLSVQPIYNNYITTSEMTEFGSHVIIGQLLFGRSLMYSGMYSDFSRVPEKHCCCLGQRKAITGTTIVVFPKVSQMALCYIVIKNSEQLGGKTRCKSDIASRGWIGSGRWPCDRVPKLGRRIYLRVSRGLERARCNVGHRSRYAHNISRSFAIPCARIPQFPV